MEKNEKTKERNGDKSAKNGKKKENVEADNKIKNKLKKLLSTQGMSDVISVNRWWEKDDLNEDNEKKWDSLEHNGVIFPPRYQPHGVKLLYKGEPISLSPFQEEIATYWAGILDNDLSTKVICRKNFFNEFKEVLGKGFESSKLEDFDFTAIKEYLNKQKELQKNKTPEEKKEEKLKKLKIIEVYSLALMDGVSEKISNYLVEPPGIFRGRGNHPLIGKLKGRILPENVSINVGPDNPVPKCTVPGHCWDKIVHNNEATWLAYYKDVNNKKSKKYVFLSASSKLKGQNDLKKYEKARKLKDHIEKIRQDYSKKLVDPSEEKKQLGVATYLIDKLALRVGNEKNDDEADTVGCCSLRVEHIKVEEDNKVTFDFLGKDSMRYLNTVQVEPRVHENIRKFIKGKEEKNDLFDLINASKLNDYLKSLMDGLSAKVFRTYNASITLQKELDKCQLKETDDLNVKVAFYNEANKQVAILCNHQKTLSKNFNIQSEKLQNQLKDHLEYLKELQNHVKTFTQGKKSRKAEKAERLEKQEEDNGENKSKIKKVFPDDLEKTTNLIANLKKKIEKLEFNIRNKEELKEIALGTSKLNYMDPRITVAWCKTYEVPIERVFTKSVRDKFPWAMYIQPSYKF